jgi:hypothetical protein
VKAICPFCGHANDARLESCAKCGGRLENARREKFKIPLASWLPAIPVAALFWFQIHRENQPLPQIPSDTPLKNVRAEFDRREADLESKHREMLQNARLISGAEASQRHAQEWQARQNHDPAYAKTILEKTLVEVERLGKDPALNAETALRKVATLVTPPGSRIEVTSGENGFVVRVAFRLAALRPHEAGSATHYTSPPEMRKEIEEVTARLIKDLFDYCGARGIERLSVSCNRALLMGQGDDERLSMRSLFRASIDAAQASNVASWRHLPIAQVASLMRVEHDVISSIMISHQGRTDLELDPNQPLEF